MFVTNFLSQKSYVKPSFDLCGTDKFNLLVTNQSVAMRKNILCVDENKGMRSLVEALLLKKYSISLAQNSFYAMQELLSKRQFDLLLLSINSVKEDNFSLLEHICSSSFLKNIPVIVLSNGNDNDLKRICNDREAIVFIKKPFDPENLLNQIDVCLLNNSQLEIIHKKRKIFNLNFF